MVRHARGWLAVVGLATWLAALLPPVAPLAQRYELVETLQYLTFGFVTPALLVVGAPWHALGWVRVDAGDQVRLLGRARPPGVRGQRRSLGEAFAFVALAIAWRSAPAVDAIVRYPVLMVFEALTLVVAGTALLADLVVSPPLRPGTSRPYRIGVSAVVMWVVWVLAYLDGMSAHSWYDVFHGTRSLSRVADQQLASGAVWVVTAAVFLPIVFANLARWLQSEEDPDDELYRLVRRERDRGFFGPRD